MSFCFTEPKSEMCHIFPLKSKQRNQLEFIQVLTKTTSVYLKMSCMHKKVSVYTMQIYLYILPKKTKTKLEMKFSKRSIKREFIFIHFIYIVSTFQTQTPRRVGIKICDLPGIKSICGLIDQ